MNKKKKEKIKSMTKTGTSVEAHEQMHFHNYELVSCFAPVSVFPKVLVAFGTCFGKSQAPRNFIKSKGRRVQSSHVALKSSVLTFTDLTMTRNTLDGVVKATDFALC